MDRRELRSRIAGALYGFAIGDAMGATTEFMAAEQIESELGRVTKIVGGGWLALAPGEVTDDSQMMACVIDALMAYPDDAESFKAECAANFSIWLDTKPKDVGATCARGIRYWEETGEYVPEDEHARGNGALMRYLPCALLGLDELNVEQGRITHNSPESTRAILSASKALRHCMRGNFPGGYLAGPQTPSGEVRATLSNALYHNRDGMTFRGTLEEAVNRGGDADTIAAISCSLAGARVGLEGIDPRLIGPIQLEMKKKIGEFVDFAVDFLFTNERSFGKILRRRSYA